MAKKSAPKKVVSKEPKVEAPKKEVVKTPEFSDRDEVVILFNGEEKTVGGFNAKILIGKKVATFVRLV